MKCQEHHPRPPVRRLRLYLGAVVVVPLFMGLMLAVTAGSLLVILNSQIGVVQVASDKGDAPWKRLDGLTGMPHQLAAAADGSLWTRTRFPGSIARYHGGSWQIFRHNAFGTRNSAPRHDLVVVGNQLWAVVDDRLVHFDGRQWQSQPIPNAAADHVLAANARAVRVLGNDGMLHTWQGGKWEATNLGATIAEAAWDLEKPSSAPHLLTASDDSMWLCSKTVWRGRNGAWAPVKLANRALGGVELLGQAAGKFWFYDGDSLFWVAENAVNFGHFADKQLCLRSGDRFSAVSEIGGRVCAGAQGGVYALGAAGWELEWPAPDGVGRCQTAAGDNGSVYAISFYLTPLPALWLAVPMTAALAGAALWGMSRFANLRYSLPGATTRWRMMVLAPVVAIAALAMTSETATSIALLIAPIACAMVFLLVPPLVIVTMAFRELTDSSLEVIRYRPVTMAQMPPAAWQWFEQNTPHFRDLGFRLVGDFRLKARSEHFARVFTSDEGDVFGEIAWTKGLPWFSRQCCAFFSVTEDLTYLETSTVRLPTETFDAPFILQSVPGATVAETLATHHDRLDQLAEDRQTEPMCFRPADVETVGLYGQKLSYARLQKRGAIGSNPYDDMTLDFTTPGAGNTSDGQGGGLPLVDPIDHWQSSSPVG